MLKKILLWTLVLWSCIWITQANSYIVNIWEDMYNTTYWNYTYTYNIDSNLNFKTDDTYNTFFYTYDWWWYAGIRSRMLFWNDNKLYTYWAFQQDMIFWQGYISWFCMSNTTDYTTYCDKFNRNNYNTNIDTFYELWAIYDQVFFNADTYQPILCFISNTEDIVSCIHQEISYGWNDQNIITPWNLITTKWIKPEQFANEESKREESPLIWWWEDEPIITWYDPETWLPCATIDTLIKYETNFKTGMCYSSTYIYSWWQMETITPKTFTELRTWYNQFNNDLNKYRNYCTPPATNEACQNAFWNEEEKRSIINKIPEERLTDWWKTLYDYCHMYLTYSGDTNICEIDDQELRSASYEDLINAMNEITITQPWTWSVFDNYKDQTARNIITALPSVYYKITSIFKNNTWVKWIIPSYITWIIILIVLFKLFKK